MAELAEAFYTEDFWALAFTGRQLERHLSPFGVRGNRADDIYNI